MRIGTWNLENLFRPDDDTAGPTRWSTYEAKLESLAETIQELLPDVLAVQEVGEGVALADLVAVLPGTWHTALADPDGRGIRVGVLSRLPLIETEQATDFPAEIGPVRVDDAGRMLTELGRPALRARVDGGVLLVDVVSVHLKSKLLSFPGGRFSPHDEDERARYGVYALHRRAAESSGVRLFATGLRRDEPGVGLVVAGDLNDEVQAATTQILLGPPGSELGTGGFDRPDKGDPQRLWNLAPLIDEKHRFTRRYRGRDELIDHILVSHELVGRVSSVVTGIEDLPSIGDDPRARRDAPGSDHRPVLAELAI